MLLNTDINQRTFDLKIRLEKQSADDKKNSIFIDPVPNILFWESEDDVKRAFISINNNNPIEIIKLPADFKAFNFSKKHCTNCGKKNLVNLYYFDKNKTETAKSVINCINKMCNIVYSLFINISRGEFRSVYKNLSIKPIKLSRRFYNIFNQGL